MADYYDHYTIAVRSGPVLRAYTSACVHRGWTEGFPYDGLTDVGGDEEGDARAQTISFLKQFVQQEHDQTSHKQLYKHTHSVKPAFYSVFTPRENFFFEIVTINQSINIVQL